MECTHNQRRRYEHGFYCDDCGTFFGVGSATYRNDELLSAIWMVLSNIDAHSRQAGGPEVVDALTMRDKIGIGLRHEDYEALIAEAEDVMHRHGVTSASADMILPDA
jgi:hypothetical protein